MKERSQLTELQKEDLKLIAGYFNKMAWTPYQVKRQDERPVLRAAMETITHGHVLSEIAKAQLLREWNETGQNEDHLRTLGRVFSISHVLDHMGAEHVLAHGVARDRHLLGNLTGYHPPQQRASVPGFPISD